MFSKNQRAKFPLREVVVKSKQVPKGQINYTGDILVNGKYPSVLVVGMVSSDTYNAKYEKQAFNFKHYNLSSLTAKADQENIMYRSIPTDYGSDLYLIAYQSILGALGSNNDGNAIPRDQFPKGTCLYLIEMQNSVAGRELRPEKNGSIQVCKELSN
jgi:hypothetical protein